jgi:hypothetical protein
MKFNKIPTPSLYDTARFLSKVEFGGRNECWNWTSTTDGKYGKMSVGESEFKAHRIAFFIFNSRQPNLDLDICHSCDNTLCVNPAHLSEGTRSENLQDMVRKGRRVFNTPKGDRNPCVKLSDATIQEIRDRYVPRVVTTRQLAKEYGVARSLIHRIVTNQQRVNDAPKETAQQVA